MVSLRRTAAVSAVTALGVGLLTAVTAPAVADPGAAPPVVNNPASVVRATALPTAQINGVAYTQVISGDTVYVGGAFTTARPAGVARGGAGEVVRSNLLAYSLSTGKLTGWAPKANNTVRSLAVSPDGTRLYVGGLFTAIDGVARYRLAAFDTATGSIVAGFKPIPSYTVQAIVATNNTVYFGGKFNNVSGVTRQNLAAVQKDTGKVLTWAPSSDDLVQAMVMTPDRTKIVVGGNFSTLSGVSARGLGSVSLATGATQPFAVNQVVYGYGSKAAFLSLATDGRAIYGTAFNFGGTGNFEGTFSADPSTGAVNWIEDCHGDTYSVFPTGATVYAVGHAHYCKNIGGFPQVANPGAAHRAIAFTTAVGGTVQPNQQAGYADFAGRPAPSLRNWFPDLAVGQATGADQAAWSVTGSGKYVTLAGEFPSVNGVAQQGLVRFATVPTSPNTVGPKLAGSYWSPQLTGAGAGAIRVSWSANWDPDDLVLRHWVTRDSGPGTATRTIYNARLTTVQWALATLTATDSGLKPGGTYRYRLFAADPAGNTVSSNFVTVTAPAS